MEQDLVLAIPMRLKVVAVVPPFPFNSTPCWKCGKSEIKDSLPLRCSSCGSLQDVPVEKPSHFELLGIPESLRLDESSLRTRYYEFSKLTHPDRFATHAEPEPQYAQRWSTSVNKAYQCLRDRTERALYLVERHAKGAAPKTQVPSELAESYFELQDLLSEGNRTPMLEFQKSLETRVSLLNQDWMRLEDLWENCPGSTEALLALRKHLDFERFLKSMLNDIERRLA